MARLMMNTTDSIRSIVNFYLSSVLSTLVHLCPMYSVAAIRYDAIEHEFGLLNASQNVMKTMMMMVHWIVTGFRVFDVVTDAIDGRLEFEDGDDAAAVMRMMMRMRSSDGVTVPLTAVVLLARADAAAA